MISPYITAILAVTALSFSEPLTAHSFSHYELLSIETQNLRKYKSDNKNCDLCVNLPKKRKTTQV